MVKHAPRRGGHAGRQLTVVTRDRMPSVHVEHTLALTAQGVVVITADEGAFDEEPKPPPPAAS